jgi:hypothetical protein
MLFVLFQLPLVEQPLLWILKFAKLSVVIEQIDGLIFELFILGEMLWFAV